MATLNWQAGYFGFENPLRILDRWLNRFQHRQTLCLDLREVDVRWTDRAERALQLRREPLIVELQLYFSCVVKKRVLFHEQVSFDTARVNDRLELAFRPVASAVCEPREFAASFPEGRDLSGGVASRMVPRRVDIDCRKRNWEASFYY
jgi:hypothetical protein